MARHRRRHDNKSSTQNSYYTPPARQVFKGKRDDFSIANGADYVFESPIHVAPLSLPDTSAIWSDLNEVEDRRQWRPDSPRGFRAASSTRERVAPTKTSVRLTSPVVTSFKAPRHVAICVRRKIRKAVLHALDKVGKGSSRPRRRNYWSNVKCSA